MQESNEETQQQRRNAPTVPNQSPKTNYPNISESNSSILNGKNKNVSLKCEEINHFKWLLELIFPHHSETSLRQERICLVMNLMKPRERGRRRKIIKRERRGRDWFGMDMRILLIALPIRFKASLGWIMIFRKCTLGWGCRESFCYSFSPSSSPVTSLVLLSS